MKKIGEITHYYSKIGVAIIKLSAPLAVGDEINIKGSTTDLKETIESMQVNHEDIKEAKAGDEVGIKVSDKVREGDEVLK